MEIVLPHNFKPRFYQEELHRAVFVEEKKKVLGIWHRRAGKTIDILNIITGLAFKRKGLYLYTFPEFKQARRNIWNGFDSTGRKYLDYIPKELIARKQNLEMMIEFANGSLLQFAGTDNYDSLVGSNPLCVIYDEFAIQDPMARLLLKPILLENDGIEIFVYTPRGRNHGYNLYQEALKNPDEWYCAIYGIDKTKKLDGSPVISEEVVAKLIEDGYPEELAKQEFYCSFDAGQAGSYYAPQIEMAEKSGRIKDFKIEPDLPVYTWWDLGISDDMGIMFVQPFGGEIRIINYYRATGQGFAHYKEYLDNFQKTHNIQYSRHYAPHDVNVRELSSGKTRLQEAAKIGIDFSIIPRIGVQDGIDLARVLLLRCYFHRTNCDYLINSLRDYHREWDEKNGCFKEKPKHDWTSHGADCMRGFAVSWSDYLGLKDNNNMIVTSY